MSQVKLFKLKKGFTLIYSYELNKESFNYEHKHKLRLYKLNKLIATAEVVNITKLIHYLYFGDYFNSNWATINGSFSFDFNKVNGNVNLISPQLRIKTYDIEDSKFKNFYSSSFKGDIYSKKRKEKSSIIKQKTFTQIYRNEIENFIYWIYNCINKNESISKFNLSLKTMMQNKIMLIEKKGYHNTYAIASYR